MAEQGEAQREGKGRWRRSGAMRGAVLQAGGGLPALPQLRAELHSGGGQRKQRSRLQVEDKGLTRNFRKFQGPNCKTKITFKLGLK